MKQLILRTLAIDFEHHHWHLPGSLSALGIIADIYAKAGPDDVFLLSKGHSCAAWYAVLESKGFKPDVGRSHPDRDPANGIANSSGSLGHGLPMAVGIALAKKLKGEPGKVNVLMGDAECMEGTSWECLQLAGGWGDDKEGWRLDNLVIHVDGNGSGCLGRLGFKTFLFRNAANMAGVPLLWYFTRKGAGIPSLEGTLDHVYVYSQERYQEMVREVHALAEGGDKGGV